MDIEVGVEIAGLLLGAFTKGAEVVIAFHEQLGSIFGE